MAKILQAEDNERLRLAVLYDAGMFLYSPLRPPAGSELPEGLRNLGPKAYTPPDGAGGRRFGGPIHPRYRNYHTDQAAAPAATTDRFTFPVSVPVNLDGLTLNINDGDPASSHIHLLIRRGQDTTAGLTDDDVELFTNPDPTAGIGALMSASAGGGAGYFPLNQPLLDPPFMFHVRAVNAGGATTLHFNTVFHCRIIEPDELGDYAAAPLLAALYWGGARGHPGMPRRRLAPAGQAPTPPLMEVCSLGFCRKIPFTFLDPALQREYIVNQINGVATPGMNAVP